MKTIYKTCICYFGRFREITITHGSGSNLDPELVEVSQHDSHLKMYFAHGARAQVVAVGTAVNQVWVSKLSSASEKDLTDRFSKRSLRFPCWYNDFVYAW